MTPLANVAPFQRNKLAAAEQCGVRARHHARGITRCLLPKRALVTAETGSDGIKDDHLGQFNSFRRDILVAQVERVIGYLL